MTTLDARTERKWIRGSQVIATQVPGTDYWFGSVDRAQMGWRFASSASVFIHARECLNRKLSPFVETPDDDLRYFKGTNS